MSRWSIIRAVCAIACLCLVAGAAEARAYTIDDLLGLKTYGRALSRPGSDQVVLEKLGRYDAAPAYPFGWFSRRLTSHLYLVDGSKPKPPELLFRQSREAGYWSAGFSPDGRSLAVVRLDPASCRLGIVNMRRRSIHWMPFSLDLPIGNPDPIWIDDHRLLVVATSPGVLPHILGYSREATRALPTLWARALKGDKPSATVIGAGRWASIHQQRPASKLMLVDLRTNQIRGLVTGDIDDIALSADHQQVAILTTVGDVEPDPSHAVTPVTPSHHHRLVLYSLTTRATREPCPRCDVEPDLLAWSPEGADLLIAVRRNDRTGFSRIDAGQTAQDLDLDAWEATEPIVAGSEQSPRAAWIGDHPIILAHAGSDKPSQWIALHRNSGPIPLWNHNGRLLDAGNGHAFFARDGVVDLDTQGRSATLDGVIVQTGFAEQDPFRLGTRRMVNGPVSAVTLDRGEKQPDAFPISHHAIGSPIALPDDRASLLAISEQGRWALSSLSDDHGTERLFLSFAGHRQFVIDKVNAGLDSVPLPHALPLTARMGDVTLHHWLFLPPGATSPSPLIVVPYPGDVFAADRPPSINPGAMTSIANVSLLTAYGFAVLYPSIPASNEQPPSLQTLASAITAGVDAAIASGRVDPGRMAIWGHSYGGYAALAAAAYDHRFRAIIASSAPIDLLAGYGGLDPRDRVALQDGVNLPFTYGWSEGGQAAMKLPAWKAGDAYEKASPYYKIDSLTAPILLFQGDADQVGLEQSERLLTGLYRLRRDGILIRYWGEGHVPVSPGNIRDLYDRVLKYLDQTLSIDPEYSVHDPVRMSGQHIGMPSPCARRCAHQGRKPMPHRVDV